MANIRKHTQDNQTFFDIMIEHTGGLDSIIKTALKNNIEDITRVFEPGELIVIEPDMISNTKNIEFFAGSKKPSTYKGMISSSEGEYHPLEYHNSEYMV
ncbi:MAG: hypothetical protein SNJ71_00175 [Bacteroidales bacterium]